MAKREIFTGPSPFFHGPVRSRDTFMRPINLIGFAWPEAVRTLSPIRRSSMLVSPSRVFMRVPARKQLRVQADVTHGPVPPRVCADELRSAKHNPNATPAHSFQPAIKLRRDVARVAFLLAEASRELVPSSCGLISKPPSWQSVSEPENAR